VFAHRVELHPKPREDWPLVSIVVPTKDSPDEIRRCLDSIFEATRYPLFEVIVVDSGTTDPRALEVLTSHDVEVVQLEGRFNFSRANNVGVRAANGKHVVLLNNDTEVLCADWLQTLVWHVELPGVGAVGPLLMYADGSVQHAGVVLGARGTADHVMAGFPSDVDGYAGSLACTREVSAVTAACMIVPRDMYTSLGGLSEDFRTHYQDVDFCLRLREAGMRVLFTPRTRLRHDQGVSRGDFYDHLDRALLLDRWGDVIALGDPYYSRNLSIERLDYSLAS
jgi:GT2 family glycosyltransferase